jgi:hypothetical protein
VKEETSKTAFYFVGAGLAGFAVLLGLLGLNRDDFPSTQTAKRAVMGVTLLLVAAAMTTAVVTA